MKEPNNELIELKQILWLMYKKIMGKITYAENIELDTYWTKYYEGWE